jgi:multiple sugar transport system permease protein
MRIRRVARLSMMAPLVVFLTAIFLGPILANAYVSVHHFTLSSLLTGRAAFTGFKNLSLILQDPVLPLAVRNTLVFTSASIVVQYVIGIALALFFDQHFPLSRACRALLILPWLLPPIVGVSAWRWIFDETNGSLDRLLVAVGLPEVPWLSAPGPALAAVIIVNVWIGIAFNLVLLHGGLQGIPTERYEAAMLDGAGVWQRFWHITMPGLRPVSAILLTLGFLYTIKQFDIVWILTRGGPGNSTQLFSTWAYTLSFVDNDFGRGAAASNLLLVSSLVVVGLYAWRTREAAQ